MNNNIPETMNISILNKPFEMELKEVDVPKLGPTDVL